jgi:hypothetical protein
MHSPALFGQTLGIHSAAAFFIIGAITGAVLLLLGIALMLAGTRRKGVKARRRRTERKEAKNAGRDRDKAQEENEKLHGQLDADCESHSSGATASGKHSPWPGRSGQPYSNINRIRGVILTSSSNTLVRSLHDVGAAGWFGGGLMGAVGLNGASKDISDPAERSRIAASGWARWAPVSA